jgi:uncharacterized membrane protein
MMLTGPTHHLTIATAIGAGISGGVFFAFSTFIMPALKRLPPEQGIAAMQSINAKAPNPLFMIALFGPAVGSTILMAATQTDTASNQRRYLIFGGAIYLLGIALTIGFHVPKNNALAKLDPTAPGSSKAWATYATTWTQANHIRATASIVASTLMTLAARSS